MISSLINIFPTLFPNTRASLWNISDSLVYRDMMVLSHEMSSQSATRKNNTTHLHKNGGQIDDHYYCYCCCCFFAGKSEGQRTPTFPLAFQRKREEGPPDPPVAEQNVTSLAKFAYRLLIIVFESF